MLSPAQPSVLVIDDDDAIRLSTAMLLSIMGVVPEGAASGHVALELVRERHFDLAIVDIGLPDIDGRDLVRELQAIVPGMRIVIMSGDSRQIDGARHLVDHCLEKPMSAHGLRAAIDDLLQSRLPIPA